VGSVLLGENEGTSERDFDDTGCNHHKVGVERLPVRNLPLKIFARKAEVRDTREHERCAEGDATDTTPDTARSRRFSDRGFY